MHTLDARLAAVYDAIPDGASVADIGTDHAFLPIALIKSGKAKSVIACDINEKPLENARRSVQRCGCNNISLRQSDGLQRVKKGEADCIVIAGMGGEVISGILSRCAYIKDTDITLILQPMTGADVLRRFLCENGFAIVRETGVAQDKRLYTVITAKYTCKKIKYDEAFLRRGMLDPKRYEDLLYLKKQQRIIKKCMDDLEKVPAKRKQFEQYKALFEEISNYIKVN